MTRRGFLRGLLAITLAGLFAALCRYFRESGIGCSVLPVRFGVVPEITGVEISA